MLYTVLAMDGGLVSGLFPQPTEGQFCFNYSVCTYYKYVSFAWICTQIQINTTCCCIYGFSLGTVQRV